MGGHTILGEGSSTSPQLNEDCVQPQYPELKGQGWENRLFVGAWRMRYSSLEVVNDASGSASLWLILFASSTTMRMAKLTFYLNGKEQ